MTPEQKLNLSLAVLSVVVVAVLAVLIFLTYRIRGYGSAIQKLQSEHDENAEASLPASARTAPAAAVEQGIPEEVVAAISAAVYMTYGDTVGAVTGIRRSAAQSSRSAWSMAGLLENTRPF